MQIRENRLNVAYTEYVPDRSIYDWFKYYLYGGGGALNGIKHITQYAFVRLLDNVIERSDWVCWTNPYTTTRSGFPGGVHLSNNEPVNNLVWRNPRGPDINVQSYILTRLLTRLVRLFAQLFTYNFIFYRYRANILLYGHNHHPGTELVNFCEIQHRARSILCTISHKVWYHWPHFYIVT